MKLSLFVALSVNMVLALGNNIPISRDSDTGGWVSVTDISSTSAGNATALQGTEVVTCYNTGTKVDRAPSVSSIDDFCSRVKGTHVANGQIVSRRYNWNTFTILVSAQAINGFVIDDNCNRLLRLPLDKCNTKGENGKQGGFETDLCGSWRYDPGSNGSDF